jgi:hypothetical protein
MGVNPVVAIQITEVEVSGRLVSCFCLQTRKRCDLETPTSAESRRRAFGWRSQEFAGWCGIRTNRVPNIG